MNLVDIFAADNADLEAAQRCAQALQVVLNPSESTAPYRLFFEVDGVFLVAADNKKHGRIEVDFCAGGAAHRRLYGGGKGQMVAKAVGVTSKRKPTVFDATAGLGGDAFVLACLGCEVTMMERSPIAYALLSDGLKRARRFAEEHDPELLDIVSRMHLMPGNSIEFLHSLAEPINDVLYLDPMFPERQKSAAVKKEMQAFHHVIGQDLDDAQLLEGALKAARYRVVVKRSRHAPFIGERKPTYELEGKSSRFDIYALRSLDALEAAST